MEQAQKGKVYLTKVLLDQQEIDGRTRWDVLEDLKVITPTLRAGTYQIVKVLGTIHIGETTERVVTETEPFD